MVQRAGETDDSVTTSSSLDDFDHLVGIITDGIVGAISGFVGVALLTGALFLAEQVGGFERASFATVGELIGLEALGPPVLVGYLVFMAHGMVTWPLLFASVKQYLPGDVDGISGMVFGTVLWTGFVPAFYEGYTGTPLVAFLALSLAGHWAYGFALGTVFDYLTDRPSQMV